MNKETYKSYDDLPLMLSVPQLGKALGISRAGAYTLVKQKDFPLPDHRWPHPYPEGQIDCLN